ncbi:MAG: hypothetical protein Kow0031_13610 [Anaerolineae bacterium]
MLDKSDVLGFLNDEEDENSNDNMLTADTVEAGAEVEEEFEDFEFDSGEGDEPEIPAPSIEVEVSKDRLYAYLTISQHPPQPYQVTVDDIYEVLGKSRVEFGVMLEKIDQIVSGQQYPTHELIAVGQPMVPSVDASLEYLFPTAPGGRPKDRGHYVDHYDLNLVHNVSAGDVLVRKIAPVEGEAGTSVYGQPLKPLRAKDVRLPAGKGTEIPENEPLTLVAKIDGFVRLDAKGFNRVVVEDIFNVHGDVHLSTGNLDIDGSVRISGSVREGFGVKATGNIIVGGMVEAATLEAGGSIEISGGIIGGKQGANLTAVTDIKVKFADNATMTAGNTITVLDEVVNCQLQADKSIFVGGETKSAGAIIGGFVSAGQEIRAVSLGTDGGILTRLRVGHRPGLEERRRQMQAEIKQRRDQLQELKQVIGSLKKRKEEREPLREQRTQDINLMEQQQAKFYRQMRDILAQAEKDGLVTSAAMVESLEAQINETRTTLQRVESSIQTLEERIQAKVSISDSLKNKKTLEQFHSARENLLSKLTDLEFQLEQRTANPWGNLPWATRRELEQTQATLKSIQGRLASLEAEDSTDQKIYDALKQLQGEYTTVEQEISNLNDELDVIKQEIANAEKISPRITVSDKLWAGTEVIIHNRRRRFTTTRTAVKIQLSENEAIVLLNLV